MLSKRVIACLDVRDGKLAKSVKFVDTKDIGDPVEKAREYYLDGLDELVFYDITASSDRRSIMLDVVERVASQVFIPFSVGGGVRSVEDATDAAPRRRGEGQRQHRGRAGSRADRARLGGDRRAEHGALDGRPARRRRARRRLPATRS